jgi:hypothetical protein
MSGFEEKFGRFGKAPDGNVFTSQLEPMLLFLDTKKKLSDELTELLENLAGRENEINDFHFETIDKSLKLCDKIVDLPGADESTLTQISEIKTILTSLSTQGQPDTKLLAKLTSLRDELAG